MLESIIDIVRRAGELVRSANDVTAATHEKNGPADLVTEYDLAVQRFLRQELLALLPEADFFMIQPRIISSTMSRIVW